MSTINNFAVLTLVAQAIIGGVVGFHFGISWGVAAVATVWLLQPWAPR
jgi:hypothetical protein